MTEQLTGPAPGPAPASPAAAAPTGVAWAPVPSVNLLPRQIIAARRFRRLQAGLATALVATLVVAVLATLWADGRVSSARSDLATAQTTITGLKAHQAKYAEVPKVTNQVDQATAARAQALATDVLWYRFLNDLEGVVPDGVLLPTMTIALNSAGAGVSGNPLAPNGIGQFTASGTAKNYQQVAALMDGLDKVNGLRSTSLSSATRPAVSAGNTAVVNVTVSAVLSSDALSGRYDKKAE
jgi:Tfp pilus assembly protein PilN